ncbi:glycoprotein [Yersinia intermedia]|uniref:Glycoprotein n=1 Tax=Yersinia intermedia TaxID=631 RepID=A0ABX6F8W3_YERIN|nr:glycoprotein [Yersinia intermedia]QGR65304.1 glycoprotein [Yersinia intermedia]QGR70321.1 glycoprotein [Yersinia intermedia]
MPKYEVVRAWNGVVVGDLIDLDSLHPALQSHVRKVGGEGELSPATPGAKSPKPGKQKKEDE